MRASISTLSNTTLSQNYTLQFIHIGIFYFEMNE